MRFKAGPAAIYQKPKKGAPITAKGPQDCQPLTPQQFADATSYVAKAFLSAVTLPKDFFSGVPLSGTLVGEHGQRTLLSAYAHFKQDTNKTLSFYLRYKALLELHQTCDLSRWVVHAEGSEFAAYSIDILSVAATQPLLPSGKFDSVAFIDALQALDAPESIPAELPANVSALDQPDLVPTRIAA